MKYTDHLPTGYITLEFHGRSEEFSVEYRRISWYIDETDFDLYLYHDADNEAVVKAEWHVNGGIVPNSEAVIAWMQSEGMVYGAQDEVWWDDWSAEQVDQLIRQLMDTSDGRAELIVLLDGLYQKRGKRFINIARERFGFRGRSYREAADYLEGVLVANTPQDLSNPCFWPSATYDDLLVEVQANPVVNEKYRAELVAAFTAGPDLSDAERLSYAARTMLATYYEMHGVRPGWVN